MAKAQAPAVAARKKKARPIPAPAWTFVQWLGDNDAEVAEVLTGALATPPALFRSLDGDTLLILTDGPGGTRFPLEVTADDAGSWLGVDPSPNGLSSPVVLIPDANGTPEGFEDTPG